MAKRITAATVEPGARVFEAIVVYVVPAVDVAANADTHPVTQRSEAELWRHSVAAVGDRALSVVVRRRPDLEKRKR